MCGRYAASFAPDDLLQDFDIEQDRSDERSRSLLVNPQDPPVGAPDWNVAPSKQAPVVLTRAPRDDPAATPLRQLRMLTWGLVPSWAKDARIGLRMINARAETLLDKGAYRNAAIARRCLVPADGWYEWQASPTAKDRKGKPRKQPFFIHRGDGEPIAFAGVYEFWRDKSADDRAADDPSSWVVSYTIVTTEAEPGMDRIHDRQPVVLDHDQWASWLDPTLTDPDDIRALLEPRTMGRFEAWPVGRAVGSSRNNGPALLEPAPRADLEGVVDPMTGEVIG
ncbi:MAG TPA: SOS response-associated peptidase [Flexivirga sp.]|uniref:SOS response-associated peptidase n=1 Tax=Flexivirga sp. TaxID=1962927 RepID=UPI002D113EE7|nr:SOS response-associated peptidase [Flexivirga sp.]HWC21338.1 SOS response-associated peptidase [Flexivirga sp.]